MRVSVSRPRFLYAFLAVPLLMGAKGNGKGCCGREEPVEEPVVTTPVGKVDTVTQITSMEPSTAKASTSFTATIFGAGFKEGASVKFNSTGAESVTFKDANTLSVNVPGLPTGSYDVVVVNADGTSAALRRGLVVKSSVADCAMVRVNFDFDSSSLSGASKSTLDGKMPCIQGATGAITVEGHADERGTTEYNLALGERRAQSVKSYMTSGGVAASRVSTVSFGEEKPVSTGGNEGAWAENRRADIYVAE